MPCARPGKAVRSGDKAVDEHPLPPARGVVLLRTGQALAEHERQLHRHLADCISRLLGIPFLGIEQSERPDRPGAYLIPDATLTAPQPAVRGEADLYGGVVSHPFMASKAISHPLVAEQAAAPPGWNLNFMQLASGAVLPGYSAFARDDALLAGKLLLTSGPLRAKRVNARAGRGQRVIQDLPQLRHWLDELDEREIHSEGVVLEQNLQKVRTFSVGQTRIGNHLLSYVGQQRLTTANDGAQVYGGSDLHLVRGDYAALCRRCTSPLARAAIDKAECYEQAAQASFPGFIASRRNCDVALGTAPSGHSCMGVLEQSWRIGGASSAEIHALLAFAADPSLQAICASSWEVYGSNPAIPDQGRILHQDDDPDTGPITKGVTLRPWQPPANP